MSKDEIVVVRWQHAKPTWEWVCNGFRPPEEWKDNPLDPDERVQFYPFWIRISYWLHYTFLGCRSEKVCSWIDHIQWKYRRGKW